MTSTKASLTNVLTNEKTQAQLVELIAKRKGEFAPIKTKQAITAEAIELLYKREIKK